MKDSPLLARVSAAMVVLSSLATGVGAYLYIEDSRRAIQDMQTFVESKAETEKTRDKGWMEIDKQDHAELVRLLTALRDQMQESFNQRENRFEELETEHKILIQAILNTKSDMMHTLGVHIGRHMNREAVP